MFDSLDLCNIEDPQLDEREYLRYEVVDARKFLWSKTIRIMNLKEENDKLERKSTDLKEELKQIRTELAKDKKTIAELEKKLKNEQKKLEEERQNTFRRKVKRKLKKVMSGKNKKESSLPKPIQETTIATPLKKDAKKEKAPFCTGVSVVIPTYKKNNYLDSAVRSVLNQTYRNVEIIIACNGENIDWYYMLRERYEGEDKIRVVYTEVGNAGAGRNIGIEHANMSHLIFLDDDDYFTEGYIEELVSHATADVELVCGRLIDENCEALTYIDSALRTQRNKRKAKKSAYTTAIYSTVTAKLFVTKRIRDDYEKFSEDMLIAEDVYYWLCNFKYINKNLYFCDHEGPEGYIRRYSENSVSRPAPEKMYAIFKSWLNVFRTGTNIIFSENEKYTTKVFAGNILNAQNNMVRMYYNDLEESVKSRVRELLLSEPSFYLNKGYFSGKKGIAFCHNFSPYIDPSAIVAPRRLQEINELEGIPVGWTVVSKNMSNIRSIDTRYKFFFTRFLILKHVEIGGAAMEGPTSQFAYAKSAYYEVKDQEADYIYSRSMFAGSHIAAYLYKQAHPNAFWYAEFSDPVLYNPKNTERQGIPDSDNDFIQDFWSNVEKIVYEKADRIIFTNANQLEYMLAYNRTGIDNDLIRSKSLVKMHPIMKPEFANIMNVEYKMSKDKINVAYFGSLPAYRNRNSLLNLCLNPDVVLHLFMINTGNIQDFEEKENVVLNKNYQYLEFLNLAKRFDYLVVVDSDIDADINPWLPSKVSDYISADTYVIAIYKEDSALSRIDNEKFVFVRDIDESFASSLKKTIVYEMDIEEN